MLYFAVGELGLDGGLIVTASHNPKEYTGMKIVREGALPVGGDSGLAEVSERAGAASASRSERGERPRGGHLAGVRREGALLRRRRARCGRSGWSIDAANGMAGAMLPPVLERLPIDAVHVLLRAGRHVPEPRAEPAPPREPRVHRREDARGGRRPRRRVRRGRRPLLLRRRHGRVRPGRLRHRAARRVDAREGAGREDHLRRARELGRARHGARARRRAARSTASATPSSSTGCGRRTRSSAARSRATTTSASSRRPTRA